MKPSKYILALALIGALTVTEAVAECQISDAKLEEAILKKLEFRGSANAKKSATCAACVMPPSRCGPTGATRNASVW